MRERLQEVKWGLFFACLTILIGFLLGAAMGGGESMIRGYWHTQAQQVVSTVYQGDAQKIAPVMDRAWTALKRAHLHAAAIGSAAAALIYILSLLNYSGLYKKAFALFLGLGALGYSTAWLIVAFNLPELGTMAAAKESIHLLAEGAVGMLFVGTGATLVAIVKDFMFAEK